jgi:hypothetical protein
MATIMELEGGCLCGYVRYRAEGEPHQPLYCHCRMCQKAAGAPLVAWVTLPRRGFALRGGEPAWYGSSPGVRRGFCPKCGTALFFDELGDADWISLTIASLDHPEWVAPARHVWTSSQMPWLELADKLPKREN